MQRLTHRGFYLWLTIAVALGGALTPQPSRAQADCGSGDEAQCLERQFRDAEQRLAGAYKQKLVSLDGKAQQALRSAEVAWIKQRDAACGSASKQTTMEGWTREMLADPSRARCLIRLANQRATELATADTVSTRPPQAQAATTPVGDPKIAVTVTGMENDAVGAPVTVTWRITENVPPKPQMRSFNEVVGYDTNSKKFPPPAIYKPVLEDASLIDRGKRWLDDQRLGFVVVSVPNTVRFKGEGFLVIPPGEDMPFKVKFERDRIRAVFPLYLPESRAEGSLTIRPLAAGSFSLSVTRITATIAGDIRSSEALVSSRNQLTDKNPVTTIQDRYNTQEPLGFFSSPNGLYDLRVFSTYFEIIDHMSGGLILRRAGYRPRFSPTGRFLTFSSQRFYVMDLLSQEEVNAGDDDDVAFVYGDSLMFLQGGVDSGRYGKFRMFSPYVDAASENISKNKGANDITLISTYLGGNQYQARESGGTSIVISKYISFDMNFGFMVFGSGHYKDNVTFWTTNNIDKFVDEPELDSTTVSSLIKPSIIIRLDGNLRNNMFNVHFKSADIRKKWESGIPHYKELDNQDEKRDSGMQVAWALMSDLHHETSKQERSWSDGLSIYRRHQAGVFNLSMRGKNSSANPSSISSITGAIFSSPRPPSERKTFWFDDGWDTDTLRRRFPHLLSKNTSCDSKRSSGASFYDSKENKEFRNTIEHLAQMTGIPLSQIANPHFQNLDLTEKDIAEVKTSLAYSPDALCDFRRQTGKFTYVLWKDVGDGLGALALTRLIHDGPCQGVADIA